MVSCLRKQSKYFLMGIYWGYVQKQKEMYFHHVSINSIKTKILSRVSETALKLKFEFLNECIWKQQAEEFSIVFV